MSKQVKSFVRTVKSSYPVSPTADDFNKVYFLQKDANSTSGYIKTGGKDYGNGIVSATYNSSTHKITFTLADGTSTSEIDCSSFLVDGMVEDVKLITIVPFNSTTAYSAGDYVFRASDGKVYKFKVNHDAGAWNAEEVDEVPGVTAAGTYLFVDFNTASGKNDVWIDVKNIFDPTNYYTKSEINAGFKPKQTAVSDPSSSQTALDFISNISQDVNGVITVSKKTVAQVVPSTSGSGGYNGLMTPAQAEKLNALPTNSELDTALGNKADKVSGATNGNFAGLDANGNLTDSGKKASDFQPAGNYKTIQTAVSDPTADGTGTAFIDSISQNANGVITPHKKNVPTVAKSTGGVGGNAGLMTAAQAEKLDGIAAGAEVNQNAFSNVKVGATTVAADAKTDTLEIVAGNHITITPDATNDKVTFEVPGASAGTSGVSKLFGSETTGSAAGTGSYSADYVNSAIANATLMWEGE